MTRTMWTPALALGAVLATNVVAVAQENHPAKPRGDDGFTMTLAGQGTAAQAAAADDTELTRCCRRVYYGGYYGGYSSWGWGGYSSFSYSAPVYYGSFYSPVYVYRPHFHHHHFVRPIPYVSYGSAYYWRIGADASDLDTPAITLGGNTAKQPPVATRPVESIVRPEGGLRYDGGPANPVPLPKPDAGVTASKTDVPVSLPKAKPASPYTYKAYGEK